MAARMREEKGWLLPHPRDQLVEIVRRRRAGARGELHRRRHVGEQAIFRIVDELVLMLLLDLLDENAELLLDLVEGPAVEIRHAGLDVEDRGDRAQEIFARGLIVIDEGLRQIVVTVLRRTQLHHVGGDRRRAACLLDAVQAEDTGFNRRPGQERNEPAGGNPVPLRPRLGGIR